MKKFAQILLNLIERDTSIFVLDNDLSRNSGTDEVARSRPRHFVNVGIAEQNAMGIAAGLALSGFTPIVHTFASFGTMRACEQIRSAIAYQNLKVLLCFSKGGLAASFSGPTHHSTEDFAIMRAIPNMQVVAPNSFADVANAMNCAVERDGPTYIRMPPESVDDVEYPGTFKIGSGIQIQDGRDVTIVFTGSLYTPIAPIVDSLIAEGISVRLLYMHTIKPIDVHLLSAAARETAGIISIEEHSVIGGLGSAIAETLSETIPTSVIRIGIEDVFCYESGSHQQMLAKYCLPRDRIKIGVRQLMKRPASASTKIPGVPC